VRALYVLLIAPAPDGLGGDAVFYHEVANRLADGGGYASDHVLVSTHGGGGVLVTAEHPPGWPLLLSLSSLLGANGWAAHRLVQSAVAGVAVIALGLLGRRVAGERVGLLAAGLGAAYPMLVWTDGSLMSETLYGLWVAAILLLAYELLEHPSAGRGLALGAVVGLAGLTRVEGFLFLPLVGLPAAWLAGRRRSRTMALMCAAVALVAAPWTIRNWSVFDRPVFGSTGQGIVLAGANCSPTYRFGEELGTWQSECISRPRKRNEATESARWTREGLEYAGEHPGRLPLVVVARFVRTWNFAPRTATEGPRGPVRVLQLGLVAYYPLLVLAGYGLLLLRRHGQRLFVLMGPAAVVTITTLLGHGYFRFRYSAELSIVTLAAVALVHIRDNRVRHSRPA
jgi:4-amino-4-deoxy-L-arabinose transferase-like glycosyltransferase